MPRVELKSAFWKVPPDAQLYVWSMGGSSAGYKESTGFTCLTLQVQAPLAPTHSEESQLSALVGLSLGRPSGLALPSPERGSVCLNAP